MTAAELTEFIHEKIPLSKALGVEIASVADDEVILKGPLSPNINHLGTAFGGSLAAIAILAGYAWVFHALLARGYDVHIILKRSETDYRLPVEENFIARGRAPGKEEFAKFLKTFERKGLARIELQAQIETSAGIACVSDGEFVAQARTT